MKNVEKTIVIDWLELSFTGNIPESILNPEILQLNGNCFIQFNNDVRNKFFHQVANLFIDYHLIGEIKFNPRTPFIQDETIHLKFANHLLYTKDYTQYITYITDIVGFNLNHTVRLDIAIDCVNHHLMDSMKNYLNNDSIRIKGKTKKIDFKTIGKEYKIVYYGSACSDKYIKIYNKSEELIKCDKKYIQYFWDTNGLDYKNNIVERLELTLKQKQLKHLDVFSLTNSDYLASICRTHFKNYFEFTKTEINHKKKYIKDVTPIKLNEFNTKLLEKYKYVKKGSIKPIKTTIKRLFFIYEELQEMVNINSSNMTDFERYTDLKNREIYIRMQNLNKSSYDLQKMFSLEEYYEKNMPIWEKEFRKNKTVYMNIGKGK